MRLEGLLSSDQLAANHAVQQSKTASTGAHASCCIVLSLCLAAGMSYQTHAGATEGPAPEHFEIRTQTQLQSACYDKPGLCMITLLDGHSEAVNQHR